ncbi:hypothetical protein [Bacillus sp. JCM 19041]|uniref:hypothetical protein n=1 Tax=Bacillus sp. JCM 19041 TaxID=1460637 RepID=UPI0006D18CE7
MAKRFRGYPPPCPPPGPPKRFGSFKLIIIQFIPPIIVFQLLRTLFLPTAFDLFLLACMIVLLLCYFCGIF